MRKLVVMVCVASAFAATASGDVFNLGPGHTSLDLVPVGNAGNTGEQSRLAYHGDTTYYGGVNYEYQIGKYEVTAGQYTEFLNAVAATDTYGLYNTNMWSHAYGCKIQRIGSEESYTYSVASDWVNRPVNFVSWYDSLRFSNWLHNGQPTGIQDDTTTEDGAYDMSLSSSVVRKSGAKIWLPSEDEWYKAAYHKNDGITGNYFLYPTSNNSIPGSDMNETTNAGNNVNYQGGSGYLIGITEVGEFELSDSPYGTFDQGGNVFEWNETLIGSNRGIRGGSYVSNFSGDLRPSYRIDNNPYGEYVDLGFRVAAVPEPCSLELLSLGGFVLRRRRR